ncbi:MAG: tetraacyldisaccharide 4'-kinase [Desulfurellaceae bacterium]|nr:tetraacyldisaccharide 4'-kinase [Desulfurellaceae bacterium]
MNIIWINKIQKILLPLLFPLSIIFGLILYLRRILYNNLFRKKIIDIKIIGVGGVTLGGAGKTPVVIRIAKALKDRDRDVCVIVSGYGGKIKVPTLVFDGHDVFFDIPFVSDEALLIAGKTNVPVISAKDRIKGVEYAKNMGFKYVILDDSFQYLKVKKDYEILVLDGENPFADGLLFPAGNLRENKNCIKFADQVISVYKRKVDSAVCIGKKAVFKPVGIFSREGERIFPRSAFIFCAIGNPLSFKSSVKDMNIRIVGERFFMDHHIYTSADKEKLLNLKYKTNADVLLTTTKDMVKLKDFDCAYLDYTLEIKNIDDLIEETENA